MPSDRPTVNDLLALPRVDGLELSSDGSRLVTTVATVNADGKEFITALWELDPAGTASPRRLTRSRRGESLARFAADGSLLFTSARPDPDAAEEPAWHDAEARALWRLPHHGEAHLVASPPGGVADVRVATASGAVVMAAGVHAGRATLADDAAAAERRHKAGVGALLFTDYPIRHWDAYLGPRETHLFAVDLAAGPAAEARDLTPDAGRRLDEGSYAVSPDGRTVVTTWWRVDGGNLRRRYTDLVTIDVASGARQQLAATSGWFEAPVFSPDGRWVIAVLHEEPTPAGPGDVTLWLVDARTGEARDACPGFDRRPTAPVWAPDSTAVYFTADDHGHTLPFRLDLSSAAIDRLAGQGTYTSLCPGPDGAVLYALRSSIERPPVAVALRLDGSDARELPTPGDGWRPPGTVERLQVPAEDAATVEAWLVLPAEASPEHPAPLIVAIHGGPVASWSGWHWRWNPHVLTAAGYAVVLPDPALSTGYGQEWIARGWGRWGEAPYTDVLAVADAVCARPDIDEGRTAAIGGSFGGYLVNWIAGHTDRFRGIVSHASLWSLRDFHGTTDDGWWWELEFGDPYEDASRYHEHSPARHVDRIRTPMLVVHGERDYRVPIGEALRLWTDLRRHGVEGQFLYFPDEHHWILRPPNIRLWYATVLAFLDHHVRERPWTRPDLL